MGKNSKTKVLQRYLLRKAMLLEDNMLQWAQADVYLGVEQSLRLDQAKAIKTGDTKRSREIHDERVDCVEKALEILRACPACDAHPNEPHTVEGDLNDE